MSPVHICTCGYDQGEAFFIHANTKGPKLDLFMHKIMYLNFKFRF